MGAVLEVLHELINIVHGHGLPKSRADELHDILNGLAEVAEATAAETPAAPPAKVPDGPQGAK